MYQMRLKALAKINLGLDVLRRKEDGYHEVKMIMQTVNIICIGKIKEKYFTDAIAEYAKRLSRYCKLDIIEVADEKTPDGASEIVETNIKNHQIKYMEVDK